MGLYNKVGEAGDKPDGQSASEASADWTNFLVGSTTTDTAISHAAYLSLFMMNQAGTGTVEYRIPMLRAS